LKHWVGINPVILYHKNQFFETLGCYQLSEFRPKKINFLKHWVGINPVIFRPKKINFLKHWVGINPVILAKKNQYFETLGWYQPSEFIP
jgi:hypothetical protein